MKYIVELKYTNPGHEHVSLRRRVDTVTRLVEASSEDEALNRAANQQRALGFKIQEAKVVTPATEPVQLSEGFDTDPKDIAAYLVDRHGKGKVTMDHIEAYERRRDSWRPIEKHEVMKHVKKMSEEVEQIDEMDKSQPSSSRGAEGLATGSRATPVKTDKVVKDALKVLNKSRKSVKEEVEQIDELKKSTLGSYINKAANQVRAKSGIAASFETQGARKRNPENKLAYMGVAKDFRQGAKKRLTGIEKATAKLAKEEVGADKRDKGYKMSSTVRAAQNKFDAQSKGQGKMRPQAGTLAAAKMTKEAADPGSVKVVNKKMKAAEKMINAAKGKVNKVNMKPVVELEKYKE